MRKICYFFLLKKEKYLFPSLSDLSINPRNPFIENFHYKINIKSTLSTNRFLNLSYVRLIVPLPRLTLILEHRKMEQMGSELHRHE